MRQRLGILPKGEGGRGRAEGKHSSDLPPSALPLPPLLLLLFRVHGVLTKTRAELLQLELFAARLATQRVIVITGFLADEVDGFDFLFSFSGSHGGGEGSGFRVRGSGAEGSNRGNP